MKRKLLNIIMLLTLSLGLSGGFLGTVQADCGAAGTPKNQVFQGIGVAGSADCAHTDQGVTDTISTIVNILSLVVGAIAVIMIIVSGFRYITSGGDSGRVGNAKNTLIYALIGVAIAALAQFLVHFVLHRASTIT
jgi:hypothetical protein